MNKNIKSQCLLLETRKIEEYNMTNTVLLTYNLLICLAQIRNYV